MPHKIEVAAFSQAFSNTNGDAYGHITYENERTCIVIADGVGSASHGAQASHLAVSTTLLLAETHDITSLFREVANAIKQAASVNGGRWSTTLTVCLIDSLSVRIGHVGDTRAYHLRGLGLQTRTKDQTELAKLLQEGVISKERAKKYPRKHILLSYIGEDDTYELEEGAFTLVSGDRVLMTTDGLHGHVLKQEIANLSHAESDLSRFVSSLEHAVMQNGLTDDATAICMQVS